MTISGYVNDVADKGTSMQLSGQKFGRWTVVGLDGKVGRLYKCRYVCDCGVERSMSATTLRNGKSRSCGCLQRESVRATFTTHGHAPAKGGYTRVYRIWKNMHNRCRCQSHRSYPDYGGRGIRVCERWSRFENFLTDMGEPPTEWHSIDRIDNDRGYEPANCRWSTPVQQVHNSSVVKLTEQQVMEIRAAMSTARDRDRSRSEWVSCTTLCAASFAATAGGICHERYRSLESRIHDANQRQ